MWIPETKTDKNLTLWVTHECNLNCVFCRDSENKDTTGFMQMEEVKRSLIYAKEREIKTVLIGGGEPTLHPNIIEIAQMCKNMGFFTVITTNYTKPKIIKMLDGICDTINISLYQENQEIIPSQYEKIIPHMGFCCMRGHTKWCEEHKEIDWLDSLPIEKVVMTDRGNPCWIYRGYPIDRKDLSIFKKGHMMVDVRGLLYDENGKWVLNNSN